MRHTPSDLGFWSPRWESNPRRSHYECDPLPTEVHGRAGAYPGLREISTCAEPIGSPTPVGKRVEVGGAAHKRAGRPAGHAHLDAFGARLSSRRRRPRASRRVRRPAQLQAPPATRISTRSAPGSAPARRRSRRLRRPAQPHVPRALDPTHADRSHRPPQRGGCRPTRSDWRRSVSLGLRISASAAVWTAATALADWATSRADEPAVARSR